MKPPAASTFMNNPMRIPSSPCLGKQNSPIARIAVQNFTCGYPNYATTPPRNRSAARQPEALPKNNYPYSVMVLLLIKLKTSSSPVPPVAVNLTWPALLEDKPVCWDTEPFIFQ